MQLGAHMDWLNHWACPGKGHIIREAVFDNTAHSYNNNPPQSIPRLHGIIATAAMPVMIYLCTSQVTGVMCWYKARGNYPHTSSGWLYVVPTVPGKEAAWSQEFSRQPQTLCCNITYCSPHLDNAKSHWNLNQHWAQSQRVAYMYSWMIQPSHLGDLWLFGNCWNL